MNRMVSGLAALALVAGCGGRSQLVEVARETGEAGDIPDPDTGGDLVNSSFTDVEPNDTPAEATPLGVASAGDLIIWVGQNDIGGSANPADYFVFESGPVPSHLEFNMCFTPAITGMTASLWKVVDGTQQTPPVATWKISNTCQDSFKAPLEGSAVYLFGVLATGGAGTYTA